MVLFTTQVSTEEPVVCKSCRKTFNSCEMMKQHVQNVIHQQMNATGPVHIKSPGEKITKSIPVMESKELDCCRDRFASSDLMVSVQENRMVMQRVTKTVFGIGYEQFDHGGERYAPQGDLIAGVQGNQRLNKKTIDANATCQRMKIIQESPVIDKNGDLYESECKPSVNGISSNSDINGNSAEGITERVDKSFAIEISSGEGMADGHKISWSSPDANVDFSVEDNVR